MRRKNTRCFRLNAVALLVPILLVLPITTLSQSSASKIEHSTPSADLIVYNAKVTTQNPSQPVASALAVRDGVFIATGDTSLIMKYRGRHTSIVNAEGHRIIPGLNDSHHHAVRAGRFFNLELRWDGVKSLRQGLDMIREQAKKTPPGQWVRIIGGWSPFQFEEKRMPTISELNQAAPNTPVFLLYLYSKGFLNAAGVKTLELNESTVAPSGSRYEFVDGGAELIADPNPTILYKTIGRLPQLTESQMLNSSQYYYRELNRLGVTSVIDAGGGGHEFPKHYIASKAMANSGELPVRVSFYLFPQKPGGEYQDFERWIASNSVGHDGHIHMPHGYELEGGGEFLVWSAGDFENFLSDRPELRPGYAEQLTRVTRLLVKNRWPIRIHTTYDESITKILDVFEKIFDEENYSGRWIIDHAETVSNKNLKRIKELGGGIAIQNRVSFAGEYFIDRYGQDAATEAPPVKKMLQMGIPVGGGTDATRVSSYNPWIALHWLVTGQTVGGQQFWSKENVLSREEALYIWTIGSAWFSGENLVKGRIAPGQYADFTVLTEDFMTVADDHIPRIEALMTVVDGKVVYSNGNLGTTVSVESHFRAKPEWSPVNTR